LPSKRWNVHCISGDKFFACIKFLNQH
jgi:hypothetical protein